MSADNASKTTLHGYLAFPGHLEELRRELKLAGCKPKKMETHGDLVLIDGIRKKPIWAMNVWSGCERLSIESVADAIRKLKAMGLRWAITPHLHHRRAELILRGLQSAKPRALRFPDDPIPTKRLGSFMLIANDQMLASSHCSKTVPNGTIVFEEDKVAPPTRAYLKLWEAFTRLGRRPAPGETCVDLGSCPGGWTWVVAKLGARVISIDRAAIQPSVAAMPGVEFEEGNAFTVDPARFKRLDWIFSDLICEPPKLLALVHRWLSAHPDANFLCSVKFKGETDFKTLHALLRIPGSGALHLNHNKNEVTWYRFRPPIA